MVEHAQEIKIAEFLSVAIQLAEAGGRVIREVQESGVLQTKEKEDYQGPVTIADLRVQKTIEENLKHFFPSLNICGEEDQSDYSHLESSISPDKIDKELISWELLKSHHEKRKDFLAQIPEEIRLELHESAFETFSSEDAIVWIDPLDGTTDFVKGNLPAVTVLIGVSIKGIGKIGIVHNVFSEDNQQKGVTNFGTIEHGIFRLEFDPQSQVQVREPIYMEPQFELESVSEEEKLRVVTSLFHFSQKNQDMLDNLGRHELVRTGGAGNKLSKVAFNYADVYIFNAAAMCFWDVCPGETLVKGMGGYISDFNLKRFNYVKGESHIIQGVFAARSKAHYNECIRRMGEQLEHLQARL